MRDEVLIVTARAGFPNGYGAASIIRKYAKGFTGIGYNVHIMLLRPSEYQGRQLNDSVSGNFGEATFEYTGGRVITPDSRSEKLLIYAVGVIKCCRYLVSRRKHIKALYFYSPDYIYSVRLIVVLCRILQIVCMGIKTESSFCDVQRIKKKKWRVIEKQMYKGFDKIFVISQYLKQQLRAFGYKKEIKVLPILIDTDMFPGQWSGERKKEIIYMGSLNYEEELQAICRIADHIQNHYCEWKLIVIGNISKKNGNIEELIKKSCVECTGSLSYEKLAERIIGAGIMILPRSRKEYSNAGFPIKLGEYLLTGAPVLATDVGEIKTYLKGNEELYLVEPDQMDSFIDKLDEIITHYEDALEVGKAGRDAAIRLFRAERICEEMLK